MPVAIQNLLQSRKAWFSGSLLLCAFVLVLLKRIECKDFVDLAKWIGSAFAIGTGIEAIGSGKSPTTGSP